MISAIAWFCEEFRPEMEENAVQKDLCNVTYVALFSGPIRDKFWVHPWVLRFLRSRFIVNITICALYNTPFATRETWNKGYII